MKILIISKYYLPLRNARSFQVEKVVRGLEKNYQIEIIAGRDDIDQYMQYQNIHYFPTKEKYDSIYNINRIVNKISYDILEVTQKSNWLIQATSKIDDIIKAYKPEVIISASTPLDSHNLGLIIKKKYDIKWIAYFSDPLPTSILPKPYKKYRIDLCILEKRHVLETLQKANKLIFTNKYAIKLISDRLKCKIADKSSIIPHIASEYMSYANNNSNYKNMLCHTGFLSKERVSIPFIIAIKRICEIHKKLDGVILVGNISNKFRKMIKRYNASQYFVELGFLNQKDTFEIASNTKGLLVVEANMLYSPFLPSKFIDYLSMNLPIVAITPSISSIRDYIHEYGGGIAVQHNINEIIDAIISIDSNVSRKKYNNNQAIRMYNTIINSMIGDNINSDI